MMSYRSRPPRGKKKKTNKKRNQTTVDVNHYGSVCGGRGAESEKQQANYPTTRGQTDRQIDRRAHTISAKAS